MNILILLVIAIFVIVGVYVGYHTSQQVEDEADGHSITIELETLNTSSGLLQIYQDPELRKTIL